MNQELEPKETPYVHMVFLTGMLAPMRNAALVLVSIAKWVEEA
jgi:hypothetical protein